MLANFSDDVLTIPKVTDLGITAGKFEILVKKINGSYEVNLLEPTKPKRKKKNETLYIKLLQGNLGQLTPEESKILSRS